MSDQPHKFRYLLPPGNNFQFVAKFKTWLILSALLMSASVASLFVNKAVRGEYMNWTIDFKGGTEIVVAFKDKQSHDYVKVDPAKIRSALEKAGEDGMEVSEREWDDENNVHIDGIVLRTPKFSAIADEVKETARTQFIAAFDNKPDPKDPTKVQKITRASWSGDRFNVKSTVPIPNCVIDQPTPCNAEIVSFFATIGNGGKQLEVKPWSETDLEQFATKDVGTQEFNQWFGIWGLDRQYQHILEGAVGPNVEVLIVQSYGVGAKAGAKLRDDATKALIYAIFLIMLYLAFRFDIRYAPGAAFATIHDAIMVIGVFSVTWTEVSLVSVAGLLTVVGFSVNDTVVVFDRIRENVAKLKDKKIERVVDISINEVLVRSILTSATVFATTLIMNIFGTGLVQNFAFAMNVGVIVGAYSSIFLAAPFFLFISRKWYSGPAPARRRAAAASVTAPAKSDDKDEE
jgi:preprotein translocase subunit SecF